MKLAGKISKRFREYHTCEICEEVQTRFKPKCYEEGESDLEISYTCKDCHDLFCCSCRTKTFKESWGDWKLVIPNTKEVSEN